MSCNARIKILSCKCTLNEEDRKYCDFNPNEGEECEDFSQGECQSGEAFKDSLESQGYI